MKIASIDLWKVVNPMIKLNKNLQFQVWSSLNLQEQLWIHKFLKLDQHPSNKDFLAGDNHLRLVSRNLIRKESNINRTRSMNKIFNRTTDHHIAGWEVHQGTPRWIGQMSILILKISPKICLPKKSRSTSLRKRNNTKHQLPKRNIRSTITITWFRKPVLTSPSIREPHSQQLKTDPDKDNLI